MRLANIGFGSMVSVRRVVAVISPDSAPIKRLIQEAKERGELIDASFGRRTQTVMVMDSGHIILSSLAPETLAARMDERRTGKEMGDGMDDG